jgi:plasmid stabilization system protein ParE
MPVKWTRTALRNLDNAIEYIAQDRPIAAKDVGQKIWDSAKLLADHPGMGRPGRVPGTRELVIAGLPFILPYVEKAGCIYILRVMHTSMQWPDDFN